MYYINNQSYTKITLNKSYIVQHGMHFPPPLVPTSDCISAIMEVRTWSGGSVALLRWAARCSTLSASLCRPFTISHLGDSLVRLLLFGCPGEMERDMKYIFSCIYTSMLYYKSTGAHTYRYFHSFSLTHLRICMFPPMHTHLSSSPASSTTKCNMLTKEWERWVGWGVSRWAERTSNPWRSKPQPPSASRPQQMEVPPSHPRWTCASLDTPPCLCGERERERALVCRYEAVHI